MKPVNSLLLAVVALVFAASVEARNVPVVNHENVAVATSSGKALSAADVKKVILIAGTARGWVITDTASGKLRGTLNVRKHTVIVDIEYSAAEFSIRYADSTNMDYRDGTIHSNYNNWIQNMLKSIRAELIKL
jgi:hypothetical protein